MPWNIVHVGFDLEEETNNFGTRPLAETTSSIYEPCTLATIQSRDLDNDAHNPHVVSLLHSKAVAVAIDSSLTLFDSNCTTALGTLSFDVKIDALQFSNDGHILFVGLADSKIPCFYIGGSESNLFPLFSFRLHSSADGHKQFFTGLSILSSNNDITVLASTACNAYSISFNNTHLLSSLLPDKDKISEWKSENVLFKSLQLNTCVSNLIVSSYKNDTILIAADDFLYWFHDDYLEEVAQLDDKVKKLTILDDQKVMIQSIQNKITVFDGMQYCALLQLELLVTDFIELDSDTVLFLRKDENTVKLCSLDTNDFKIEWQMDVAPDAYLCSGIDSDNILYIQGEREENNITGFFVKRLSEKAPDQVLRRHLRRLRFNEAEKFAITFNLNIEEVHKAKAQWMLSSTTQDFSERCKDLIELLNKITDLEFVGQCCLNMVLSVEQSEEIYEYAEKRLANCPDVEHLVLASAKRRYLLATFKLIHPQYATANLSEEWLSFQNCNLLNQCCSNLRNGDYKSVAVIFKRHQSEMCSLLKDNNVVILQTIQRLPNVLGRFEILISLFPIYVEASDDIEPFIWLIKSSLKDMEELSPHLWPTAGYEFMEEILNVCNHHNNKITECKRSTDCFSRLSYLMGSIKQLCLLRNNHFVSIKLSYLIEHDGTMELLFSIFDKVPTFYVSGLIKDFVNPYCVKYNFTADTVILAYVTNLALKINNAFNMDAAAGEERVIAFVFEISNKDDMIKGATEILQNAQVPWSKAVTQLFDQVTAIDHPNVKSLAQTVKRVPGKVVLKKYGLPTDKKIDVHKLMQFIFAKGESDMLKDACTYVNSLDSENYKKTPYYLYLANRIEEGELEDALVVLQQEDDQDSVIAGCECCISLFQRKNAITSKEISPVIGSIQIVNRLKTFIDHLSTVAPDAKRKEAQDKIVVPRSYLTPTLHKRILEEISQQVKRIPDEPLTSETTALINTQLRLFTKIEISMSECCLEMIRYSLNENKLYLVVYGIKILSDCFHAQLKKDRYKAQLLKTKLLDLIALYIPLYTDLYSDNETHENIVSGFISLVKYMLIESVFILDTERLVDILSILKIMVVDRPNPSWFPLYNDLPGTWIQNINTHLLTLFNLVRNKNVFESNADIAKFLDSFSVAVESFPPDSFHSLKTLRTVHSLLEKYLGKESQPLLSVKLTPRTLTMVSNLLLKIFCSANVENTLTPLVLMNYFKPDQALTWTKNVTGRIPLENRAAFHQVAMRYHSSEPTLCKAFFSSYLKDLWAKKFHTYGIPLKAGYRCIDHDDKSMLMVHLMNASVQPDDLYNFTTDFGLNSTHYFLEYLTYVLLNWQPTYRVYKCPFKENIKVEDDGLREKCCAILSYIPNDTPELYKRLQCIPIRINYYFYEVFAALSVMYKKLQRSNPDMASCFPYWKPTIITFYSNYLRESEPGQVELRLWEERFPDAKIHRFSKYRMPLFLYDVDIIRNEILLHNYNVWIDSPVKVELGLNVDSICVFAVKNLRRSASTESDWELQSKHAPLLKDIAKCIDLIANKEWVTSTWYFVVNYVIPPGADQVIAAQNCYLRAEEYFSKSCPTAEYRLKIERKYYTISAKHILYKHGLAEPSYLKLAAENNFAGLITALYHDSRISTNLNASTPGINQAVENLSIIRNINIGAIKKELLLSWLNSVTYSFTGDGEPTRMSTSEIIARVRYMFTNEKQNDDVISLLMNKAFQREESDMPSVHVKLLALECLIAITTPSQLSLACGKPLEEITEWRRDLRFISELLARGIQITINKFKNTDKKKLVENLLKRNNETCTSLAIELCETYNITNRSTWNNISKEIIFHRMFKTLEKIIFDIEYLVDSSVLVQVWNYLIVTSIRDLLLTDGKRVLELVKKCPIVKKLDTQPIIILCQEQQCDHAERIIDYVKSVLG